MYNVIQVFSYISLKTNEMESHSGLTSAHTFLNFEFLVSLDYIWPHFSNLITVVTFLKV